MNRGFWKVILLSSLTLMIFATHTIYSENSSNNTQYYYTSGMVNTRDKFTFTYGRFEICARLPKTQGLWQAHWLLPNDRHWPPEIDIMELLGHRPNRVYMTFHWGSDPVHHQQTPPCSLTINTDFSSDFHIFRLDWSPKAIEGFVDDNQIFWYSTTANIPNEPFYLILNTAIGGNWPKYPDSTTIFPQYHDIDYVRVYEWDEKNKVFKQTPVFDDEFDGSILDTDKWTSVTREKSANHNNEWQYYRPENVAIVKEGNRSFLRLSSLKVSQKP